jgi:hypothetical protein
LTRGPRKSRQRRRCRPRLSDRRCLSRGLSCDDVDRPLWETGEERVLAAAQCIVLATRSDLCGEVEIEIRVGADLDDQAVGQPLFDGELLTTGQGILVGNSLPELHHVELPIGWHPIRIYAEPPSNPARFTVLLEVRPAGG